MEQLVRPEQVGCGTKGGAEAAVHAARCLVEEVQLGSRVLLKLDFKNAFNTIHRHVLLQLVRDSLPEYLFPSETELSLLGAPLLKEGLLPAVQEKTSNLAVLQSRLNLLCAHQALFLLKNCLGLPKLLYVLRCSPAWKVPEALKEFDESIRVSLSAITNTE